MSKISPIISKETFGYKFRFIAGEITYDFDWQTKRTNIPEEVKLKAQRAWERFLQHDKRT